jgi:hypothetical protein
MNFPFNTASGDPEGELNCKTFLSGGIVQHTNYHSRIRRPYFDFQSADDFWTAPRSNDGGLLVDTTNHS